MICTAPACTPGATSIISARTGSACGPRTSRRCSSRASAAIRRDSSGRPAGARSHVWLHHDRSKQGAGPRLAEAFSPERFGRNHPARVIPPAASGSCRTGPRGSRPRPRAGRGCDRPRRSPAPCAPRRAKRSGAPPRLRRWPVVFSQVSGSCCNSPSRLPPASSWALSSRRPPDQRWRWRRG